jgi:AAA+ superfamily predicted ATPase
MPGAIAMTNQPHIQPTVQSGTSGLQGLLPALQWLDRLLQQAVIAAQAEYGRDPAGNDYQGLYVSAEAVERLLAREPGAPGLPLANAALGAAFAGQVAQVPRFQELAHTFGLGDFDLAVLLIALAPEVDLRYERLYGYLQDDITRRRASVDLALNLLCPSGESKLVHRAHFAPNAPLRRQHLLHLVADPHQIHPPDLAYALKLDEPIVRWLLDQPGVDTRLAAFCEWVQPTERLEALPLPVEMVRALRSLVQESQSTPLRFYFHGPQGVGKRQTAAAIAHALGQRLWVVNLARLPAKASLEFPVPILFREAQLHHGVVYVQGLDEAVSDAARMDPSSHQPFYQPLLEWMAQAPGVTILAGRQPWLPIASGLPRTLIPVAFPLPDFAHRRDCWQRHLTALKMPLTASDLDILTARFRLTPDQIADAVAIAHHQFQWQQAQSANAATPTLLDLFAAARKQSGDALRALARKVEPHYGWADIVLPPDPLAQLKELCNQVKYQHTVYQTWGFERRLSLGKGLNVLFSGTPGTGKTMAAEVLARELQLDLYRIDLSQIVSKYIGETEKNLDRIFTAADSSNAILLFDEADALFGKRSEVKDAHDRYANLEVAYLLQKMEEYEGITILTTNLRQNLDEAFTRRIRFIIEFPLPEAEYRRQIWQVTLPPEMPLAPDIDLDLIAQQFRLAGGNIRNIVLAAAFLAAEAGEAVGMAHVLKATKREFQKMGRLVSDEEFLPFAGALPPHE